MGIFLCRCGGAEETLDYDNIGNYDGEKRFGKRHGKGVYYFENGDIYDGQWESGKKHGYGCYTYADGSKEIGFFFNDLYVGKNSGNLFAEKVKKESDPAKPLLQEHTTPFRNYTASEEALEETRKRLEDNDKRREARRQRREEMRRKYNL